MTQPYKKALHHIFGIGGVRCPCCRPASRVVRRALARVAKRKTIEEARRLEKAIGR